MSLAKEMPVLVVSLQLGITDKRLSSIVLYRLNYIDFKFDVKKVRVYV